jgi:hypothetical protein
VGEEPHVQNDAYGASESALSRRVLAHSKSSLAPKGPSLVFELREGKVYWSGQSSITANALAAGRQPKARRDAEVHKAEEWLRAYLRLGPRPAKEGYEAAASLGIATRTLMRAKKANGSFVLLEKRCSEGRGGLAVLPQAQEPCLAQPLSDARLSWSSSPDTQQKVVFCKVCRYRAWMQP